jgi:putative bacteriocin precursor
MVPIEMQKSLRRCIVMKKVLGKKPQMSKQTIETYGSKTCNCYAWCECIGQIPRSAEDSGLTSQNAVLVADV